MKRWIIAIILGLFLSASIADAHILSWSYTTGGNAHTGFKVYRKKTTDGSYILLTTTSSTARAYTDADRTAGNCYQVAASNQFGETKRIGACASPPGGTVSSLVVK